MSDIDRLELTPVRLSDLDTPQSLSFTVQGDPVGKGRPRIQRTRFGVRTFTPDKTTSFEARVRAVAHEAMVKAGRTPLASRVSISVVGFWTLPPSKAKKRAPVESEWRTQKPDVDNVLKAVCDALNGTCYLDDVQVCTAFVEKWTAAQGEPGRTEVTVISLDGEWAP